MAEPSSVTPWPVEQIPDAGTLYMRVHRDWLHPNGTINIAVFRNRGSGMSTDWSRYSTPQQSRDRAKKPADNAIISMVAGKVRAVPGQTIAHSPLVENRAHTDIEGEKNPEARVMFGRIVEIVLQIESPRV